jgi:glutathione S-transferase
MSAKSDLFVLTYSPWSEKARWALDHHRVPYRLHVYVPMVHEPWLRLRLRKFRGRVSVPTFVSDAGTFRDSFDIAREAERIGEGEKLFPADRLEEISSWNDRSERALRAARDRVIARMGQVPGAEAEGLTFLPRALRSPFRATARTAVNFLRRKYDVESDLDASQKTMRAELEALRNALGNKPYLLGDLSYADITMAVVLQVVLPVSKEFIRLGPAMREVWTNDDLAREFADLIEWRDALYAKHRRPADTLSAAAS